MSPITIRRFHFDSDYEDVCAWWRARPEWQPLPPDHINGAFGFVAECDGKKLCAIWLWLTGSAFAILDYLVSSPTAPLKAKARGMGQIIEHGLRVAKAAGAKSIFSSLKNQGLEKLFCKHGFQVTDREMVNLLARV